jgi:predicted nuclease with TOPRIM domain
MSIDTKELRHELLNGGLTCIQTLNLLDALDASAATIAELGEYKRGCDAENRRLNRENARLGAESEGRRLTIYELSEDNARLTAENQSITDTAAQQSTLIDTLMAERDQRIAEHSALRERCAAASEIIDWVCGLELELRGGDSAYLPDDGLQKISYELIAKAVAWRGPQPQEGVEHEDT